MKDGKLLTTEEHNTLDVILHNKCGLIYRHVAKGTDGPIKVGSLEKGPVVLDHLDLS